MKALRQTKTRAPTRATTRAPHLVLQRKNDARCVEKREALATAGVDEALDSPGQSLDVSIRVEMESRFAHDFANVRVHWDATAADAARAVNARAYTLGNDIVFGAGAYEPHTQAGKRLLAHELTHVVQQGDAKDAPSRRLANAAFTLSQPSDRAEQEASRGADAIIHGMDFAPSARIAPGAIIQRADDEWNKVYDEHRARTKSYETFKGGLGELKATSESGGRGIPAAPEITFDILKEIYPGLAADVAADKTKEEKAAKYLKSLNQAFKILKIDTVEAQSNYLAHAFVESDQFRQFTETQGWMDVAKKGSQKWEDKPENLKLEEDYLKRTYVKNKEDTKADVERKRDVNPHGKFEFIGRGPVQVTGQFNYVEMLALLEKTEEYYKGPGNKEKDAKEFADLAHRARVAVKADPQQAANPDFTFLVSAAHMKKRKADVTVGWASPGMKWAGGDAPSGWVAGDVQTQKAQVEALATKSSAYDKIYGVLLNEAENKNPAAIEALKKKENVQARKYLEQWRKGQKKPAASASQVTLQRSTATEECDQRSDIPPIVHEALDSSGQPLDTGTRALFEPRFGHDFGGVRVHIDSEAAESARAVNALAYTVGRDVVFGAGQFAPHSYEGRKLIAHELTHVVQQRSAVQLPDGVGKTGDRYEQRADAVASRVVAGEPVKDILEGTTSSGFKMTDMTRPTLQREEVKKARTGVKEAVTAAEVTSIIDRGLAQIDEKLVSGTKKIRLAIRNDAEFTRAWQDYVDRKGNPGASMGGELTGFVDDTHPDGETGFVRASAGIGTVIHEAMHQRASPGFRTKVGNNINEGTTELFTRVVIAYAGGKIDRNVYEDQKRAMLRLQGISGLEALAQWYFRGDRSAVEKKLGSRLEQFMYWMDSKEAGGDPAGRADSAINAL